MFFVGQSLRQWILRLYNRRHIQLHLLEKELSSSYREMILMAKPVSKSLQ